jgi:hypothetical protein
MSRSDIALNKYTHTGRLGILAHVFRERHAVVRRDTRAAATARGNVTPVRCTAAARDGLLVGIIMWLIGVVPRRRPRPLMPGAERGRSIWNLRLPAPMITGKKSVAAWDWESSLLRGGSLQERMHDRGMDSSSWSWRNSRCMACMTCCCERFVVRGGACRCRCSSSSIRLRRAGGGRTWLACLSSRSGPAVSSLDANH